MCIDVVVKLHPFDAIAQSDMAGILPHMKNYKCKVQDRLFSLDHRHIYNSPYTTPVTYLTNSVFHVLAWDTDAP